MSYRDRLKDPAFVAAREALWKARVGPELRETFRGAKRNWDIPGKDVVAACKAIFLTGETEEIRQRKDSLWYYLSKHTPWAFRLMPFHGEEFWSEFFSKTIQEWSPGYDLSYAFDVFCSIYSDHSDLGWPVEWDAGLHCFFYGERYNQQLTVLGQTFPHPQPLERIYDQWSASLSKTLLGVLPTMNKWTATYDYWLSTLPLLGAEGLDHKSAHPPETLAFED